MQSPVATMAMIFGILSKTSQPRPFRHDQLSLLKDKLTDVLATLTERERKVLNCASGWWTVTCARSRVGNSTKSARTHSQLEAKALRKLRQSDAARQLQGLLISRNRKQGVS